MNREKNFALDNNLPDAKSNILRLDPAELGAGELYLWTWCELYLRFDRLRQQGRVTHVVEIRTEELNDAGKIGAAFDALGLAHSPVRTMPARNTNREKGLPETQVSLADIRLFDRFMNRVPAPLRDRIDYLHGYDPYRIHGVSRGASA